MTPAVCVVGGGPAGLRAAEVSVASGANVAVYDSMPSVGRKFLVAGRGGLNITNAEPPGDFVRRYSAPDAATWESLLGDFGPTDLRAWVEGFGISTFVGSGKRIYPDGMKSAPLLRRWITRLRTDGVVFHPRHRLVGIRRRTGWDMEFETPAGRQHVESSAVVLALGGASWPQTGSDGRWFPLLETLGVRPVEFQPANCGWNVEWSRAMLEKAEGKPLKNIRATAAGETSGGELLITRDGLEGGVLYALTRALRRMETPVLEIDLKPAFDLPDLLARLAHARTFHWHEAMERWRIDPVTRTLLEHHPERESWSSIPALAAAVKACPLRLRGPRPIAEAISTAGGVCWGDLDDRLMLRSAPGLFLAGEMIDWEAPTGGFLMQGCFSTGTRAGRAAAEFSK